MSDKITTNVSLCESQIKRDYVILLIIQFSEIIKFSSASSLNHFNLRFKQFLLC